MQNVGERKETQRRGKEVEGDVRKRNKESERQQALQGRRREKGEEVGEGQEGGEEQIPLPHLRLPWNTRILYFPSTSLSRHSAHLQPLPKERGKK